MAQFTYAPREVKNRHFGFLFLFLKHLKMNKEVRMLLPKKDLIQVEYIGKINNYYEDIYIPPYNNTD